MRVNEKRGQVKPEALLPLDRSGNTVRALLFFDGPSEGGPTPFKFDLQHRALPSAKR
jgi:hypothetical protein